MNPFTTSISDIWRQIQPLVQREINKSRFHSGSSGSIGSGTSAAGGPPYLSSVYSAGNQVAYNNSWTTLSFSHARNQGNLYNIWNATNPTRLTVSRSGYYAIGGSVRFGALGANGTKIGARVLLNASTSIIENDVYVVNKEIFNTVSGVFYLSAGNFVELQAFQDYGVNHTVYGGFYNTTFWIHAI